MRSISDISYGFPECGCGIRVLHKNRTKLAIKVCAFSVYELPRSVRGTNSSNSIRATNAVNLSALGRAFFSGQRTRLFDYSMCIRTAHTRLLLTLRASRFALCVCFCGEVFVGWLVAVSLFSCQYAVRLFLWIGSWDGWIISGIARFIYWHGSKMIELQCV